MRGTARTVEDPAEVERLGRIGVWPWAELVERNHWIRIATYSVTGRQPVHPAR